MKHLVMSGALGGASAFALIASAGAGWSLTAQEAWDRWQGTATAFGQTVTVESQQSTAETLTLHGVTLGSDRDATSVVARIAELVLTGRPDGTVLITLSDEVPVTVTTTTPPEEAAAPVTGATGDSADGTAAPAPAPAQIVVVSALLAQQGLEIVGSDVDGGTRFAVIAPALTGKVTDMTIDGEPQPFSLTAALGGLGGYYILAGAGSDEMSSEIAADTLDLKIGFGADETQGLLAAEASISELASRTRSTGVGPDSSEDIGAALRAGMSSEGHASYGPATFAVDHRQNAQTFRANGALASGTADFTLDADEMSYDVSYEGLALTASGSSIPVPDLKLALARADLGFGFPAQPSDTAAPFRLKLGVEGLAIDEALWSMVDPAGVLPRDAATLAVDLAGTGRWSVDMFDTEAMTALESTGGSPGEVESVDLKALTLDALGARLTGNGAFRFDPTQPAGANGMPTEGTLDLALDGGMALLDNLTKAGLIPQDQIMMVRMMVGMFAKPGKGADELTSQITVAPGGGVMINGAPMPF